MPAEELLSWLTLSPGLPFDCARRSPGQVADSPTTDAPIAELAELAKAA